MTALGTCYNDVFKFISDNGMQLDESVKIVHGKFRNTDGKLIGHAWVKITPKSGGSTVWEPQSHDYVDGETFSKRVASVDAEYSFMEVFRLMIHTGTHGPWTPQEQAAHLDAKNTKH